MNGPFRTPPGDARNCDLIGKSIVMGFSLATLLAAGSTVRSEGLGYPTGSSYETQKDQWRKIDSRMSPTQYSAATTHNRRLVLDTLEHKLVALGVSEQQLAVVSAIASVTVGNPKISLNKTMSLQLKDAIDQDRSLSLEFKLRW